MGEVLMSGIVSQLTKPFVSYTITFDNNDGTLNKSYLKTNRDNKLSDLPIAIRDNYTFLGWFTAPSGGTQITDNTVFTGDTTVYAQWKLSKFTITVTGSGNRTYAYIRINNTQITSAGTYTVNMGDVIYCYAYAALSNNQALIKLNNKVVASADGSDCSYNYTPNSNATIELYNMQGGNYYYGQVYITEQ